MINDLFEKNLSILNIGLELFEKSLEKQRQEVYSVDWKPPANGNLEIIELLSTLDLKKIEEANKEVLKIINSGEPELIAVKPAKDLIKGMTKYTIGHAGPPIEWESMCGPLKGAILGAIVYEELAETLQEAEALVLENKIKFVSNHSMGAVGPMTGMITYSMPLLVVKNTIYGNCAYTTFNEGLGKVMRFGANDSEVIARLKWLEKVLGPYLNKVLELSGPIPLKVIMSKALTMGDEMHQRNVTASLLIAKELMKYFTKVVDDKEMLYKIVEFISGNEQFFLNIALAAAKSISDPAKNIPYSTVVTAMSRNGTNFGIKISGMGDEWFEAPVNQPKGLYFPGYSEEDANPDIGDSAIVEVIGIGGFAMGASPAIIKFIGGDSVEEALDYSKNMRDICVGLSQNLLIPNLDFMGTATGIDILKVIEIGVLPVINTGMAHKNPGIGQVGAGIVTAPYQCFEKAFYFFFEKYFKNEEIK